MKGQILQTFFARVELVDRNMIDAAAGGSIMTKSEDEAYGLIKVMAANNYQSLSKMNHPKKVVTRQL